MCHRQIPSSQKISSLMLLNKNHKPLQFVTCEQFIVPYLLSNIKRPSPRKVEGKKKKKSEPKPPANERAFKEDMKSSTVEKDAKEHASATVPTMPIVRRETLEETEEERKNFAKEQLE